jgi:succinate dehydrogenase cytochrome b subunit
MPGPASLYRSAIGKKAVMAASGLLLTGFVVLHAWGNAKLFQGAEHFNAYARFLREVGEPILPHEGALWLMRMGLLLAVGLHILTAWQLTRQGVSARPMNYAQRRVTAGGFTAPVMRVSGALIALFAIYHLLHLTTGTAHPAYVPGDAYHNVVAGFRQWPVSLVYVVAVLALGAHLRHGIWSAMQSLGLTGAATDRLWRAVSIAIALAVTAVNVSIPIAVLAGLLG